MASEWITYRTRFLIKARQLDAPLTFVDAIGREHSGQKGDYLVLASDGSAHRPVKFEGHLRPHDHKQIVDATRASGALVRSSAASRSASRLPR
jgi:hypothetical protein